MLWHVLNGEINYKQFIDSVVRDAHDLSNGTKNLYNIDRENYYIIIHLVNNDESFFRNINVNNISVSDYNRIDEIMSTQRHLAFA